MEDTRVNLYDMAESWGEQVAVSVRESKTLCLGTGHSWGELTGVKLAPFSSSREELRCKSALSVWGGLSVWLADGSKFSLQCELYLHLSGSLLYRLAEVEVEDEKDIRHLANDVVVGFEEANILLGQKDRQVLASWASGDDVVLRSAALTHPLCPEEGKVAAYLKTGGDPFASIQEWQYREWGYSGLVKDHGADFFTSRITGLVSLSSTFAV